MREWVAQRRVERAETLTTLREAEEADAHRVAQIERAARTADIAAKASHSLREAASSTFGLVLRSTWIMWAAERHHIAALERRGCATTISRATTKV